MSHAKRFWPLQIAQCAGFCVLPLALTLSEKGAWGRRNAGLKNGKKHLRQQPFMNPRDFPWHERLLPERGGEMFIPYIMYGGLWFTRMATRVSHYIHYPLFLPRLLLQHFLFHLVIPQNEAAARGDDAAAINQAGGDEIAGGLRPENIPFVADARQVCSHVVDF